MMALMLDRINDSAAFLAAGSTNAGIIVKPKIGMV